MKIHSLTSEQLRALLYFIDLGVTLKPEIERALRLRSEPRKETKR